MPLIYSHVTSHEPENQWRRYWDETSTPLFPFGFGLNYGDIKYTNLTVDRPTIPPTGTITVSVEVTNTGDRQTDEVIQLYLHQRNGSAIRPVRELKGFRRISLGAGETNTVRFEVGPRERQYRNAAARHWVLDPSILDVWVGSDSTAEPTTTFEVTSR